MRTFLRSPEGSGRPVARPFSGWHEHACTRGPHLRLDPAQQPLLDDIESNTQDRLAEADQKGWLGEVAALEETVHHIRRKRTQLTPSSGPEFV